MSAGTGDTSKLKVFISYSRADLAFVDELAAGLEVMGFATLIDRHSLREGEEWKARLSSLIAEAGTVVFVLSPDSVKSPICVWEVEEAGQLAKRILPVLWRELDEADPAPQKLAALQYVRFDEGRSFMAGLKALSDALLTDLDWLREHTRLLARAMEWDRGGRSENRLMSGKDIDEAKAWAARRPQNAPEITELHLDFIHTSETAEKARNDAAKRQLEERERLLREAEEAQREEAAALAKADAEQKAKARAQRRSARLVWAVGVLAFLMLAGTLRQVHETALREARVFTSVAEAAFEDGYCDRALRLALAGLPPPGATILSPDSPELDAALPRYSSACRLKLALMTPGSQIVDAAWSPDGRKVASISTDRIVRLWDPERGTVELASEPESFKPGQISFSSDGRLLLVKAAKAALLFDGHTLKLTFALAENDGPLRDASLSNDGTKTLTLSGDTTARVWDTGTGQTLVTLKGHTERINSARFSPDGSTIVTTSQDDSVKLWSANSEEPTKSIATQYSAFDAAFSPDGKTFATTELLVARTFDSATGAVLQTFRTGEYTQDPTFSPDGKQLAVVSLDRKVIAWDVASGAKKTEFNGHSHFIRTVQFNADGSRLLTASEDGTARIWDAASGSILYVFKGHSGTVGKAAWNADGGLVLTLGADGEARIWHAQPPAVVPWFAAVTAGARMIKFSHDGRWMAVSPKRGALRLLDTSSGRDIDGFSASVTEVVDLSFSGDSHRLAWFDESGDASVFDMVSKTTTPIGRIAAQSEGTFQNPLIFLNHTGTLIAVASGHESRVFDAATGKLVASQDGHTEDIHWVSFNRDGTRVATCAGDNTARLWELPSGKLIAPLIGHTHNCTSVAFTPDQIHVVSTSFFVDQTLVWDAKTGAKVAELDGSNDYDIGDSFSSDGKYLALGTNDREVSIVDLTSMAVAKNLPGHTNSVDAAVFGHNDRWLLSVSNDGTARVWDLASGQEVQKFDNVPDGLNGAAFLADDKYVLVKNGSDRDASSWALSPMLTEVASDRRKFVCEHSLSGVEAFASDEMTDIILRGRDDLRNPCLRHGPLSTAFYADAVRDWLRVARRLTEGSPREAEAGEGQTAGK
jgi:WD40 repeat protein